MQLNNLIRKILLESWDPCGVGDNPNLINEYDDYVNYIIKNKTDFACIEKISEYLKNVEQKDMGSCSNYENLNVTAEKVFKILGDFK